MPLHAHYPADVPTKTRAVSRTAAKPDSVTRQPVSTLATVRLHTYLYTHTIGASPPRSHCCRARAPIIICCCCCRCGQCGTSACAGARPQSCVVRLSVESRRRVSVVPPSPNSRRVSTNTVCAMFVFNVPVVSKTNNTDTVNDVCYN